MEVGILFGHKFHLERENFSNLQGETSLEKTT